MFIFLNLKCWEMGSKINNLESQKFMALSPSSSVKLNCFGISAF